MAGRYCVWHLQHWQKVRSACYQCPHTEKGGLVQAGCRLDQDQDQISKLTSLKRLKATFGIFHPIILKFHLFLH
ncbi:hypothetical protein AYI68_g72 [Smittium mucronatum]|uniref:Uncharacterized protein n=1 Tax=Smittium mucronatum TaxID=133383 RepID=A0A1R0H9F5_9FUNG|nr:hypothetical protein AYI68_g72 [Smittium mucronatum]